MARIKLIGMAVLTTVVLAAATATASAHEFVASKAGMTLKVRALNTQVFTTAAGKVECKAVEAVSGVTSLKSETMAVTVQYKECKAFGLAAEVSPAEYLFNANGTVNINKAITIKATALCTVTVPAQEKLGTVTYKNSSPAKTVTVESNITAIKSKGEGSACKYAEEGKGTYAGNVEESAAETTVEWK